MVIKLIRDSKPETCEMWVKDKNTGMLKKCTNKISFILSCSGGFLCKECATRLHRKNFEYYRHKFKDGKKYLNKWFK